MCLRPCAARATAMPVVWSREAIHRRKIRRHREAREALSAELLDSRSYDF